MGHCTDVGPGVKQQYVVNICNVSYDTKENIYSKIQL